MTKSAAEIRKELKQRTQKKGKTEWWSLKEGTAYLRVLPPWKKGGEFWKDVLFHGGYKDKVYCRKNDLNEETGKPKSCPICKRVLELKTDHSTRGKKLWRLIRQRNETLWNVLVAKVKRLDGKVKVRKYIDKHAKVWRLSKKWSDVMIEFFADEDLRAKSVLGITHPKYGRLVKVTRTGTGRDDTNYSFRLVDNMSPVLPEKEDRIKIMKTSYDLDKLVHGSSKEELEAFLLKMEKLAKKLAAHSDDGEDEEDDEDEDDAEEETSKKKKKAKSYEEDEEDDDEEDGDGDSDDEEDEDEDEDEEEEGEDDEDDDLEKKYKKMKKQSKREEDDDD